MSWTLGTIPVTATPAGNFSVLIDTIALPFNAIYTFSTFDGTMVAQCVFNLTQPT